MKYNILEQTREGDTLYTLVEYIPNKQEAEIVGEGFHTNKFVSQIPEIGKRIKLDTNRVPKTKSGKPVLQAVEMDNKGQNEKISYKLPKDEEWEMETFDRDVEGEMDKNIKDYWERKLKAAKKGKPYPRIHNTTLNLQVGSTEYDGHEDREDDTWNEDGYDSDGWRTGSDFDNHFDVGLIWTNVTIPNASTINSAVITCFAKWQEGDDCTFDVYGVDVDSASAWGDANKPSDVDKTTASVSSLWDYSEITDETWEAVPNDVSTVVKEIVDRGGWASGNNLGLILYSTTPTGASSWRMQFQDYGQNSSYGAKLDIDYTAVTGPTGIKTVNDTAIASVKTINDTAIASVKTIMDAS